MGHSQNKQQFFCFITILYVLAENLFPFCMIFFAKKESFSAKTAVPKVQRLKQIYEAIQQ